MSAKREFADTIIDAIRTMAAEFASDTEIAARMKMTGRAVKHARQRNNIQGGLSQARCTKPRRERDDSLVWHTPIHETDAQAAEFARLMRAAIVVSGAVR